VRTASADLHADGVEALATALEQIGLDARAGGDVGADVVLVGPNGPVAIEVKAASLADPARVAALVESYARDTSGRAIADVNVVVLVADALPEASREILRDHRWGYLDRRGRLWLRTNGILINDTDLEPLPRHGVQAPLANPLTGRVALGMAVWMLMHSDQHASVRAFARELDCAPSTAHDALRRLQDAALVEPDGRPLLPELFWATADVWQPQRHYVSREPASDETGLALNLHDSDEKPGWAVSGDLAAAAWGARLVVSSGTPPDFYLPSAVLRRAVRQLGPTNWSDRAASLAVAPLAAATRERFDRSSVATPWLHWPLAHPVIVALDLAQDRSRGREILSEWKPPKEFSRVW
jgi:hypothetical protein